jgi:hypothetical protein
VHWLRGSFGLTEGEARATALAVIDKNPLPRPPKAPEPPLDDLDGFIAEVKALCEEVTG